VILPISASQVAEIIDVSHCTQSQSISLDIKNLVP
jgi:hypothetical protein